MHSVVTGEHDPHRTPEGQALNDLVVTILKINGRLVRVGDSLSKDFDLTSARWQVLGAIRTTPKTVAQIARDLELSRQGVLFVVRAMTRDGLVSLIRNPDHQRAKLVAITPSGSAVLDKITEQQIVWVNALAKAFNPAHVRSATAVLTRLGEALLGEEARG